MADAHDRALRVLAIAGWGRCGSTLLDLMLGQLPGFVSAGEVRELWLRGCRENRPCGCGEPFASCSFWTAVGQHAFGGWGRVDLERMLRVRYRIDRPWRIPELSLARRRGIEAGPLADARSDLAAYLDTLDRLLRAIRDVAGASVVIDSSKLPSHNLLLQHVQGLDLRVAHLVRDSRGVAFSNLKVVTKRVTNGTPTFLPRHGAIASSLRYDLYNGLNGRLFRDQVPYLLLRYEDLVADPIGRLRDVVALAGQAEPAQFPFLSGAGVTMGENHLVDGHPVRFNRGLQPLRADDWQQRLPGRQRLTVTALTRPWLAGYGYPVHRSGPTRDIQDVGPDQRLDHKDATCDVETTSVIEPAAFEGAPTPHGDFRRAAP